MDEYEDSTHDIGEIEPNGYNEQDTFIFYLRYEIDRNSGEPLFSYRVDPGSRKTSLSASGRDQTLWSEFRLAKTLVRDLDINLYVDTLVIMQLEKTHSYQEFYWSKQRKAIKTKRNHKDLYFYLRYLQDDGQWMIENDGHRTAIQFRAKHAGGSPRSHKFSCNIRYLASDNFLDDYEIDPDIKNPSA